MLLRFCVWGPRRQTGLLQQILQHVHAQRPVYYLSAGGNLRIEGEKNNAPSVDVTETFRAAQRHKFHRTVLSQPIPSRNDPKTHRGECDQA